MADLPLVLAGPILRRVEPRLVSVWVALRERRALVLSVFEGRQQAGTGPGVFSSGDALVRGAANTVRFGDKLHVGVAIAELPEAPAAPLVPGLNYSYNLGLADFVSASPGGAKLDPAEVTVRADLKSLGFLSDQPVEGHPNKALGYTEGELPGFALPPATLTDLRILHGSCRRPAYTYPDDPDGSKSFDGLAWIDDLILEWRRGTATATAFDPTVRPHQLFLTGDQIYADDVSSVMLPMLNRVGNELIGGPELLPTHYPPKDDDASRERYVNAPKQSGFATLQAFVDDRKSKGRDPLKELKNDRRVRVLQDRCFERGFRLVYGRPYSVDPDVALDTDANGLRHWPADLRHFPTALRGPVTECEAQFTADAANHLMSFGEYCAMYLAVWSNAVWKVGTDGRPELATADEVYKLPLGKLPQLWELHSCFEKAENCIARDTPKPLEDRLEALREDPDELEGFARVTRTLNDFYDSLPRVRRALANVPTYMALDDHDVTDDWNLGRAWRDRVFTAPLGRRILTNALVACVAFQDWGNEPLRYRKGPYQMILDLSTRYQPLSSANPSGTETEQNLKLMEKLFGLNQADPEEPAPQLKWHFTVDGPRHRVVVLDTRTRRAYRSRYLPPGLLSAKALDEQLPDPQQHPLPPGIEMLVVVSQTPPVLPTIATRYIVPAKTRLGEFKHHSEYRRLTGLEPDNEIWPGDDLAFEALLKRLAAYEKVVVVSGEVHFGASGELTYWTKGPKRADLAPSLEAELNRTNPIASTALRTAFEAAGVPLSTSACVSIREGNDEWLVVDVPAERMFLVRKEPDGLNVYEEEQPARIAQFVSSGMKNLKGDIFKIGRFLGFAFALSDLTPAERLGWEDNTPQPVKPPDGARVAAAVKDRFGSEPVLLPTVGWPAGTKVVSRPDFAWRADAVQDERPDAERPAFARAPTLPDFDPKDVPGSYGEIAKQHAALLAKFRLTRGALTESNFGVVRFEREPDGRVIACQDLYAHPPGKHEGVLVNTYRVALQRFGDERPKLSFVPAAEA